MTMEISQNDKQREKRIKKKKKQTEKDIHEL